MDIRPSPKTDVLRVSVYASGKSPDGLSHCTVRLCEALEQVWPDSVAVHRPTDSSIDLGAS